MVTRNLVYIKQCIFIFKLNPSPDKFYTNQVHMVCNNVQLWWVYCAISVIYGANSTIYIPIAGQHLDWSVKFNYICINSGNSEKNGKTCLMYSEKISMYGKQIGFYFANNGYILTIKGYIHKYMALFAWVIRNQCIANWGDAANI